jgi:hypothetical protein
MAWSTPKTFVVGDVLTASEMNTYVSDNTDFLNTPPSARVYNSANLAVANNTNTILTFNSERWDNNTIHSTVTNTGRLTCRTAGLYHIYGHASFASSTDAISSTDTDTRARAYEIRLNGTTTLASIGTTPIASEELQTSASISTIYSLAVDNYVELRVWQNSGGSLNIVSAGNYSPEFGMTYLGKVS